jgi:hypothetical protein
MKLMPPPPRSTFSPPPACAPAGYPEYAQLQDGRADGCGIRLRPHKKNYVASWRLHSDIGSLRLCIRNGRLGVLGH